MTEKVTKTVIKTSSLCPFNTESKYFFVCCAATVGKGPNSVFTATSEGKTTIFFSTSVMIHTENLPTRLLDLLLKLKQESY